MAETSCESEDQIRKQLNLPVCQISFRHPGGYMSTSVQSSALPSLRVLASPTTYKDLDDYDLVLACQHQNQCAFNELYKRYVRHVRSSLNRVAPDWFNIHDDLVQECFLRVWKHSHTIKNPRAFKRWLDQMVSNL